MCSCCLIVKNSSVLEVKYGCENGRFTGLPHLTFKPRWQFWNQFCCCHSDCVLLWSTRLRMFSRSSTLPDWIAETKRMRVNLFLNAEKLYRSINMQIILINKTAANGFCFQGLLMVSVFRVYFQLLWVQIQWLSPLSLYIEPFVNLLRDQVSCVCTDLLINW